MALFRQLFPPQYWTLRWVSSAALLLATLAVARAEVSLEEMLSPSAFHSIEEGPVLIRGTAGAGALEILIRVTDRSGKSTMAKVPVNDGKFSCRYPVEFPGASALRTGMLFVDVTDLRTFDPGQPGDHQAEAALIIHGGSQQLTDFPNVLITDLIDSHGGTDASSSKWPAVRSLVNLYVQSRGAYLTGVRKPNFDLANPEDFRWFKNNLSLYDFANRDRDWSTPLGGRPARTFWQASSNAWFNPSNDNPIDGNESNRAWTNYRPYAFSNDYSDWLILQWMRRDVTDPFDDTVLQTSRDATRNLLAMQHRAPTNFALPDSTGKRENYTSGAFRYGMFITGEMMSEGTGWFYNPRFKDYINGGVLNGRCTWGLGEALRQDPTGPLAAQIKEGIGLALKFCLHDGLKDGYTKKTPKGNAYWMTVGEHSYLLLGMLAAYEADHDLLIPLETANPPAKLKDLCVSALNSLVDLKKPGEQWSSYANEDSMAICALSQGAMALNAEPDAPRWLEAASKVADGWLAAKVDPKERSAPCIHFGYRSSPGLMTHNWMNMGKVQFYYYLTGHWIHALSDLYAATGNERYRQRAEALVTYLCGNNPLKVRLLTETGGVYNWSDDTNGDGIEDTIKADMYPESTAFVQIGILRLLKSLPKDPQNVSAKAR